MMGLMFPIYFLSLILSAGLTLLSAYQILELSDLDCNFIHPQRCCNNLNKLVIPEILCVSLILILHLITLNWIPVASTFPMVCWLIYTYRSNRRGNVEIFDSTSISDDDVMNQHVRHSLFKVIFYLLHFLGYMYMAILTIIIA